MSGEGFVDLGIEGLTAAREIGRGGFGVVYEAEQPTFRRKVAVKVLHAYTTQRDRDRFEREQAALGALSDHPNIVTVFDTGFTATGQPYLTMQYLPGGTLDDRLRQAGGLPWPEVVDTGVRVSGALHSAHLAGVLHRDVKPHNIMFASYGAPMLGDFGIARTQGGARTSTGVITASVLFSPPEIIEGGEPTVAADVYALGATLFAALAGRAAFERDTDESVFAIIKRIGDDPVPDMRAAGVPPAVCAALERAMAKDPAQRQQSALEFGEELRAAQRDLGEAEAPLVVIGPGDATRTLAAHDRPARDISSETRITDMGGGSEADRVAEPPPPPPPPPETPKRPALPWLLAGAGVAAAIVLALILTSGGGSPTTTRGALDTRVTTPPTATATTPPATATVPPATAIDPPPTNPPPTATLPPPTNPPPTAPAPPPTPPPLDTFDVRVAALPSGLRCADLIDQGFGYAANAAYWILSGRPSLMDADNDGIPCETRFSQQELDAFYFQNGVTYPTGLLCRDVADSGGTYRNAVAYWILERAPGRMDADGNGIPCETVYDVFELDAFYLAPPTRFAEIPMPFVLGLELHQAIAFLEASDLGVNWLYDCFGSPDIGGVVSQFPEAGAAVSPGQVTEILLQANDCG